MRRGFVLFLAAAACAGDDGGGGTSLGTASGTFTASASGAASAGSATATDGSATTDSGTSGPGTTGASATQGGSDGGTGSTGAGSGTGPDPRVPVCWLTCGSAADCSQGSAGWDEDNYQCNGGKCEYQGCNSDEECQMQGNFLCAAQGTATELCLPGCGTPDDCSLGTPDFDADNYACNAGACEYQGCNSDAECQLKGSFLCRDTAGSLLPGFEGVPTCVPACDTAADCNQGGGAYDADNYECTGGACIWTGCNSSDECGAGRVCE